MSEAAAPGIVWVGTFKPTYPMFWRYVLGLWLVVSALVCAPFFVLGLWAPVVAINAVVGVILGAAFLWAAWMTHRPRGGPECLFAVSPEGAHYHAGPELRHLGQPYAQAAAAATGNLTHLLMLKGMESANDLFIPWEKVRSLEIRPDFLLVYVSKGLRGPVPLFCTAENFEAVSRYVLAHAPQAKVKGWPPA